VAASLTLPAQFSGIGGCRYGYHPMADRSSVFFDLETFAAPTNALVDL
jgi:hypothetical protein